MGLIISLFLFGLAVGSFLNVLIDRLSQDKSIVSPPSHCDYCKKTLAWYDLIPVFSFLMLRGRCRYCKKKLSWQYPVVEVTTGVFFLLVFLSFETSNFPFSIFHLPLIFHLFIVSALIVIFFADLKYGIIPDKIVFPAIAVNLVFLISQYPNILISHILSAVGAFVFFLAIFLFTRGRGMGFGDVKLALLLGLFLGFPNIVFALYAAFLTGALVSIILLVAQRKKLKEAIAFGPFMVSGSLFVFFFEEKFAPLLIWILPG